jgi:hypothetical protein
MPLRSIEVGKPYPGRYPKNSSGLWLRLSRPGLQALGLVNYQSGDRKAWERGRVTVSVYAEDSVPFLALRNTALEMDSYFNVFQWTKQREDFLDPFLSGETNALTLVLIDRQSEEVRGLRQLGIRPEMMEIIQTAASEQLEKYSDGQDVNRRHREISSRMSVGDLIREGDSMEFGESGPFS